MHYIENICFSCINVHIEAPAVVYSDHFSLLCVIYFYKYFKNKYKVQVSKSHINFKHLKQLLASKMFISGIYLHTEL